MFKFDKTFSFGDLTRIAVLLTTAGVIYARGEMRLSAAVTQIGQLNTAVVELNNTLKNLNNEVIDLKAEFRTYRELKGH